MKLDSYSGNVVFFQSYGTSWREQVLTHLVQSRTYGPYVHVAICLDRNGLIIEAGPNGIAYSKLPTNPTKYSMCTIQTVNVDDQGKAVALDLDRLEKALLWAISHLGKSYGFLDLVDQAFNVIYPANTLHLAAADHFDCSNFACAFLDKAGIWLPSEFTYPFNVSPNDLAEWFGLLPLRRRIRK